MRSKIENNTLLVDVKDKSILKRVKKLIKFCDKNNLNIKFNILIEDEILCSDLKNVEKAINIKNKEERFSFIYDIICMDLDQKIKTNYCKFKNDICIRDREKNSNHKNGCCEAKKRGKCEYLINSVCTMKTCMACKLFTCSYLRKKGIKHNIDDYVLSSFFNTKEKDILKYSFWTPKELVINRLLQKDYDYLKSFK